MESGMELSLHRGSLFSRRRYLLKVSDQLLHMTCQVRTANFEVLAIELGSMSRV